jgi:hypothetical protein
MVFCVGRPTPGRRPSDCATTALGTCVLASREAPLVAESAPTPGRLAGLSDRIWALTSTSILGTTYEASALTLVMYGSVTWQSRGSGLSI